MGQDRACTPTSHLGDVQSPATLTSVGSAVSVHVAPDAVGTTERTSDDLGMEIAPALPPIKNSYNQSMPSPKMPVVVPHGPSMQRSHPPRLHSPKVRDLSPPQCNDSLTQSNLHNNCMGFLSQSISPARVHLLCHTFVLRMYGWIQ